MDVITLRNRYPDLFVVSKEKDAFVKDIVVHEGDERVWKFSWRRSLTQEERRWEEELKDKIQGLNLRFIGVDRWTWSRSSYSVKETYDLILEGMMIENPRNLSVALNGLVPK